MENIIMATFPVESEAYQAFSELKRDMSGSSYLVSQGVLLKKEGNSVNVCESFDSGAESGDDTFNGGLIGSCIGILGGPVGILLGASLGTMAGAMIDAGDMVSNSSLLEKVAADLTDGTIAILALSQEESTAAVDSKFSKFNATVKRYDAAEVQDEIEAAMKEQLEMEKHARAALRKQRTDASKEKLAEMKTKIAADFDSLKARLNDEEIKIKNELNGNDLNNISGGASSAKTMLVCSACGNTMDPVKAKVSILPGEVTECPGCHQVAMTLKKINA